MSGPVITFTADILAHARASGMSLDHADVAAINQNLNSVAVFAGGVTFAIDGRTVDLGEAVEVMSAGFGKPAGAEIGRTTAASSGTRSATERAIAKVRVERAKLSGAAAAVAEAGNPWSAGPTFNRTAQAVITLKDPAFAARLRDEATTR